MHGAFLSSYSLATVTPVAILIVWIAPLAAVVARMRRGHLIATGIFSALCTIAILWLNATPWLERLSADSPAGLTAIILLASTVVLFVLGTLIVRLVHYQSVQGRLVVSFVLIITVPVVFATAISAFTAYSNSQSQFGDSLQAITSLKQGQIDTTVQAIALQMSSLQQGTGKASSVLHVLERGDQTDETYRLNLSIASTILRDLIVQYPASHFEEVLVLDPKGNVVLSTYALDEGANFAVNRFSARAPASSLQECPGSQANRIPVRNTSS